MVPEQLGVRGEVELVPSRNVFPADEVELDGAEVNIASKRFPSKRTLV